MREESGDSSVVDPRLGSRDRKVEDSSPGRSGGRMFFSRSNFVLISAPVPPPRYGSSTQNISVSLSKAKVAGHS